MELNDSEERGSVEDRRGGKKKLAIGGGIGAVVIALIASYIGIDPKVAQQIVGGVAGGGAQTQGTGKADGYSDFSAKLLGSTNTVWKEQFRKNRYTRVRGAAYEEPKMVLFSEGVESEGCGYAPSAVGPFYCPASRKVFLDPTFFEELESKLGGSKAEFSQAYVIGHEVGHHVQNLLRYETESYQAKDGKDNAGIRMELQADYLAGVWAHHAKDKLKINENDITEALKTARSIGDNRIQEKMKGKSWPESFNHGRDDQRLKYFKLGFRNGDASEATLDKFFDRNVKPLDL